MARYVTHRTQRSIRQGICGLIAIAACLAALLFFFVGAYAYDEAARQMMDPLIALCMFIVAGIAFIVATMALLIGSAYDR